ncbi:MAG: nucleotide exchange factor GrpE [Amoebophilaceae bacterium]|nr:nucleotide exchange factor GrpE [Amoebophilaceae bacterium]
MKNDNIHGHGGGCCQEPEIKNENECCGGGCCSMDDTCADTCCNSEDTADVNSTLKELQEMVDTINDKYVRLYSEFDNFKKRTAKERLTLIDHANEKTLKELLTIVDDFERSLAVAGDPSGEIGTKLIYDKLVSLLKKFGVTTMPIEVGSLFDADLHEAIMQQPVENAEMKGKIITVTEKGYLMHENVLRFAKVVIGL